MDREHGRRGFTVVEVLAVIGIIVLLVGLLLPALSGAKKMSLKTRELNAIRQLIHAWAIYANSNGDSALPGWLDPDVQEYWRVEYEYPNQTDIPADHAAPWPWRLAPLLEYSHEVLHGYADEPEYDQLAIDPDESLEIAMHPGFGYNAKYVGGWYEMVDIAGEPQPRHQFYDARADLNGDGTVAPGEHARVVVTSIGRIRRSAGLVVFCSSSTFPDGTLVDEVRRDREGEHWVSPAYLTGELRWRVAPPGTTETVIEILGDEPVPIGRYTNNAATAFADGHTDTLLPGKLADQRYFIDIADRIDFTHQ
jgi:hypothetical protein